MKLSQINYICIIIVLSLVSSSLSTKYFTSKKESGYPVILIPGDGGSQIEAKLNKPNVVHYLCAKTTQDYFNIWLNLELLVPLVIDCWIDNMKLMYNNVTRKTSNPEGVEIRVPGFGNSTSVEWLDPSEASPGAYFKDIGNTLAGLGYVRDKSLRGAPYDFRKAPNENADYFVKLKALVEETFTINGKQPVILLAHSMGGPMSLHFLQQQPQSWKDKYIRALVSLSGAWGGTVKALKVFAVGDDLGTYVLRQSILRAQQITSPSLSWLLPSSLFWKSDEVLVKTDTRNYTINDFKDFFNDIQYPVGWEMRKDVEQYSMNFEPPGVEVHCLHGFKVNTVSQMMYKAGKFPNYPDLVFDDGDGTVNIRSLEGCLHWQGKQKQKVYHQPLPGVDHMGILTDIRALSYIKSLVGKLVRGSRKLLQ